MVASYTAFSTFFVNSFLIQFAREGKKKVGEKMH